MVLSISRRTFLGSAAATLLPSLATVRADPGAASCKLAFGPGTPFSFQALTERAQELAKRAHTPPRRPAPRIVEQIDYEAHGKTRYRRDCALFGDGAHVYPVTFFHLGRLFPKTVKVFWLNGSRASEVRYTPDYFDMPARSIARRMPKDAGFAGFRVHESRESSSWKSNDWVAFLGASYFRAIGDLGQYGLSARGVAVDTASPEPEEFPDFVEFYLAPAPSEDDPVVVYALLDGPSITGAYRFELRRTKGVVMDVEKRLFVRHDIHRLGIAPLTSMFWYAEYNRRYGVDWRPEVHDSDGLAIWTGHGERLWRPLNNPAHPVVSSFADESPRGFGLLQRDRELEHYLDGVNYHLRPSLWVEPVDDWGPGAVQLVELPTDDEIHDNIVALWHPAEPVRAGASYRFRYRLHWLADEPFPPDNLARCVATRIGRGGEPGKARPEGVRKFVVGFSGGPLVTLERDAEVVPVVTASRGAVSHLFAEPIPETRRWRVQFDLAVDEREPTELRAYLRLGERPLTETWLYQYFPSLNS